MIIRTVTQDQFEALNFYKAQFEYLAELLQGMSSLLKSGLCLILTKLIKSFKITHYENIY